MPMRRSDATFINREVVPVLERLAPHMPIAADALRQVQERVADAELPEPFNPEQVIWRKSRRSDDALRLARTFLDSTKFVDGVPDDVWNDLDKCLNDLEGFAPIELMVSGSRIPYIDGRVFGDGKVQLTLDDRFGFDTTEEELIRWAPFLADAMAVSAGRTSHGENSYVRNPHGRSGCGDPPTLPEVRTPDVDVTAPELARMRNVIEVARRLANNTSSPEGHTVLRRALLTLDAPLPDGSVGMMQLEAKSALLLREVARLLAGGGLSPDQEMMLSAHIRGDSPHGGALCPRGCPLETIAKADG